MADLMRRRDRDLMSDLMMDPWRRMRELMSLAPFREMAMGRPEDVAEMTPAFELKETKDAFVLRADVPGVKEKDLEVSVTGNTITVSGNREEEKREQNDRFYTYERTYGSFSRSFRVPEGADVDNIRAELSDGVMTLMMPKSEEVQSRKIEVKKKSKS
jgi:HSP20 family protein